tara:strand:- start:144 stop:272 length:129 start_codon:yes stop_codon:yes gene_type:complete
MTINEWMELGYSETESKDLIELEYSERQYEKHAHIAFYSKHL